MKTKMLVLIGIAVCAILLTAPALASAGYSKIYGNANEDDVLDMRDVTYIKLVIFGKKPATTFADANYDGKISMLDIGQAKLIILGKEKKLILIDHADRTVTINKPVEQVVLAGVIDDVRTLIQLGATDKIVGTPDSIQKYAFEMSPNYWSAIRESAPELRDLPTVGGSTNPNTEIIVSLKPDVVFGGRASTSDAIQAQTGIPVVCTGNFAGRLRDLETYRLAGTVIGKEKEAEELISYANRKIAEVTEVTSEIPDSEKPIVYFSVVRGITTTHIRYDPIEIAGGISPAKDVAPPYLPAQGAIWFDVTKEQVIAWNPDIILLHHPAKGWKGRMTIEDVLSDPDLQTVNAVKNRRIYYSKGHFLGWDPATGLTECFYMAKLFHPDKFEYLEMEKEGNEILKRFYGADGLYTKLLELSELHRWE